jgi:spore maturation protein CgeB
MRFVMFYHSLVSDWNHGNAHFLRGIVNELLARGHQVDVYEPENAWSVQNLVAQHGQKPLRKFHAAYPLLQSSAYRLDVLDLDATLEDSDVVIVHEWNDHALVKALGEHRSNHDYRLLFHDTHHRMVTAPESMSAYDLSHYDGVLAYGKVLEGLYRQQGRVRNVWTWHEAADTRVFYPYDRSSADYDLIWIGNWGDGERSEELREFVIEPVRQLGLRARIHGVQYPLEARSLLADSGIDYAGWLPNFDAPRAFSRARLTLHVPRRPYVEALPGIPTIRVFEALACGIPLLCSPWRDVEGLFRPGKDFLVARDGGEMMDLIKLILNEKSLAESLASEGLQTIRARHTCAHRVDELLHILSTIEPH